MNALPNTRPNAAGILNLTPDSFYSGARCMSEETIRDAAVRMKADGAGMIDIGACSTRPGSSPVSADTELDRLAFGIPLIQSECPHVPLSVDTFRPEIAEECIMRWDISVINDISGGCDRMYDIASQTGVSYILTFSRQVEGDAVEDMMRFFREKLELAPLARIPGLILDPGFGFGKTLQQNYRILNRLDRLKEFGLPVLAGLSRKTMAYRLLEITPEESLEATVALNTLALTRGADWLRVHDVRAAVQAIRVYEAFTGNETLT